MVGQRDPVQLMATGFFYILALFYYAAVIASVDALKDHWTYSCNPPVDIVSQGNWIVKRGEGAPFVVSVTGLRREM